MSQPQSISVIIPSYNAGPFLRVALDSVARQTLLPFECLVVDDGSTDGSAAIVSEYGPAFRLIRQANRGRAAAVNRAADEAKGEWLAMLDADDFWLPELLEQQMVAVDATPTDSNHSGTDQVGATDRAGAGRQVAMVYCRAQRCDASGNDVDEFVAEAPPMPILPELLCRNFMNGCGACVRANVFRRLGGLDQRFWPADDHHLWLRIAARYGVAFQPRVLGCYRMHGAQASAARLKMQINGLAAKLDFLRRHPDVRAALGDDVVRNAIQEPFIDTARQWFRSGHQPSARAAARVCIRHWPLDRRSWALAIASHLPWRMYARRIHAVRVGAV